MHAAVAQAENKKERGDNPAGTSGFFQLVRKARECNFENTVF
jgi:hypothetical protein